MGKAKDHFSFRKPVFSLVLKKSLEHPSQCSSSGSWLWVQAWAPNVGFLSVRSHPKLYANTCTIFISLFGRERSIAFMRYHERSVTEKSYESLTLPTETYCMAQRTLLNILNNLNRKRIWKRKDTHIGMTDSLCRTPGTETTVLTILLLLSRSVMSSSETPWTAAHRASLSFTISRTLLRLTSTGCHPTISSFVVLFSSCLQSFPASGSFLLSQLFFAAGGQSIGVSASVSVPPMNMQSWFPLGLTGLISLQSKGFSRVFSTIWKHQFFGAQSSLWSNSHIYTGWRNHSFG